VSYELALKHINVCPEELFDCPYKCKNEENEEISKILGKNMTEHFVSCPDLVTKCE